MKSRQGTSEADDTPGDSITFDSLLRTALSYNKHVFRIQSHNEAKTFD